MTLDQRARQAADGLRSSVEGHPLLMMSPATARRSILPRIMSFAGAFAAVLVAGFLLMQTNMFASDESADTTPPTSTTIATSTTLPEAPPSTLDVTPVVPPEGGGGSSPSKPAETAPEVAPDTSAPELVVTSPLDGDRLKETAVAFQGKTEPGAVVMAGPYEAAVAADGTWSIVLILGEGGNRATFTATDAAGNTSEATLVVYYDPPTPTTTKPPTEWKFTANAKYGECALDPPYDEYYGTAAPGTKILITSDFGSGSTVANASGEWWAKVKFPGAPSGKAFSVRVKNETTFEKYFFEFVSLVE